MAAPEPPSKGDKSKLGLAGEEDDGEEAVKKSQAKLKEPRAHTSSAGTTLQQAYCALLICQGLVDDEVVSISYDGTAEGDISVKKKTFTERIEVKSKERPKKEQGDKPKRKPKQKGGGKEEEDVIDSKKAFRQLFELYATDKKHERNNCRYVLVLCNTGFGYDAQKHFDEQFEGLKVSYNIENCRTIEHYKSFIEDFETNSEEYQKIANKLKDKYENASPDQKEPLNVKYRDLFNLYSETFCPTEKANTARFIIDKMGNGNDFWSHFDVRIATERASFTTEVFKALGELEGLKGDTKINKRKVVALDIWHAVSNVVANDVHASVDDMRVLKYTVKNRTFVMKDIRDAIEIYTRKRKKTGPTEEEELAGEFENFVISMNGPRKQFCEEFFGVVKEFQQSSEAADTKFPRLVSFIASSLTQSRNIH